MIVGKGLLARAFATRLSTNDDVVIFASGVSNSLETRAQEFARERALLSRLLEGGPKRLVYFGSCSVMATEDGSTPYVVHKKSMESLVLSSPGGLVLRLPQVVGVTNNPHTLTNFLRDRIQSGEHFTVWKYAQRNLVDVDDVAAIGASLATDLSLGTPSAISIAAETSIFMPVIVGMFERALRKPANCTMIGKGAPLPIDARTAATVGARLGINLGAGYIENVIRKYYAAT